MEETDRRQPVLLVGSSHPELGVRLATELGVPPARLVLETFTDGEPYVNIEERIQGRHVFVLQSCLRPAEKHLLELCLILRAARDLKPATLTAVLPFMPFRRQERRVTPGEPIGAKLAVEMIENAGATHAVAIDLHATTNETFFHIPLIHLHAWDLLADALREDIKHPERTTIVSPDEGSQWRVSAVARRLDAPIAMLEKQRPSHDRVVITDFSGDVRGRDAVLVDDEICTGNTAAASAAVLRGAGARHIRCAATHAIFAGKAYRRIQEAGFRKIFLTDTIPFPSERQLPTIQIVSVAPLLAEAIRSHISIAEKERFPLTA